MRHIYSSKYCAAIQTVELLDIGSITLNNWGDSWSYNRGTLGPRTRGLEVEPLVLEPNVWGMASLYGDILAYDTDQI